MSSPWGGVGSSTAPPNFSHLLLIIGTVDAAIYNVWVGGETDAKALDVFVQSDPQFGEDLSLFPVIP
jgi:hypothetical protein